MYFDRPFFLTHLLILIVSTGMPAYSQSRIKDIPLPSSEFRRVQTNKNTFSEWLRELPLKPKGSDVINYRGGVFKTGNDTSVAFVTDIDIKGKRLEQCMDILIRFYAEYLWDTRQVKSFKLPLPGGYWIKWSEWKEGFRPTFKGIHVEMRKLSESDLSYKSYQSFLNTVYSESHTQQFYFAYQELDRSTVQIGDMIIRKGTKGHAVMIVDLAKNYQGDLIALIGNGDTPACQFFLLNYKRDQPWIPLDFEREVLQLPLKRKLGWDGLRRFSLPKN